MSKVRIYGDTSGYVDIDVPAEAGTRTLNLDKIPQTDTSGNTGIGTDTPSTKLHVQQSTDNTAGGIQVRNSGDTSGMYMYVDSSNDGHIDMGSAGNLEFRTNSTTQAIINTSGQLILGNGATTTALTNVTIYDGADNSQIQFVTNNTGTSAGDGARVGYNGNGVQLWNFENTYARIATNNIARMYITNTGQFEFSTGTADGSPNYDFDFWTQTTPTLSVRTSATSGQDAVIRIEGARTGSTGDTARIDFVNGASTGEYTMAKISGYDPTGSSSAMDGGIRMQTADNNSMVTVLEVDHQKEFLVGDVNEGKISSSTRFTLMNDDNPTGRTMDMWRGSSTASNHIQNWYSNVGGTKTLVAAVEANGDFNSATSSYAGISDARLKENIVDATSQLDDIKAVQVRNFNFINTPYTTLLGVVAQELEASGMTGLVKTANDEDSGEEIKSVKYSVLYMKAIKALQETIAKVEALEQRIAALESE